MKKIDMHVHTNYSDGLFSPEKVVELAVHKGLSGISITDHDTTEGLERAINHSKKYRDFTLIPGIEFSCIYNDEEVHILGYFIDYKERDIVEITSKLRRSRYDRTIKIIEKLNELGMGLTLEDVLLISGSDNNIGRPHIARALIKKGYITNIQEGFNKYLNRGKPAYVERYQITIEETVNLIKKGGGISVLAHPGLLKDKNIVNYCILKGIDGIEAIHSKHTPTDNYVYKEIAKSNGLFITGGSDCHGEETNGDLLLGRFFIDIDEIPELKERVR